MQAVEPNMTCRSTSLETLEKHQAQEQKLKCLREHLQEGADQAAKGQFVENFSMDKLLEELNQEG